jgi:hypothetical protein
MDGERMRLLKISQDICRSAPELQPLYENAAAKDWVARLNGLYVGLTRAKEEMYVIGVRAEKDKFPFDILPAEDFPKTGTARTHTPREELRTECRILHLRNRVPDLRRSVDLISVPELRRGEFLHKVLSNIVYIGDEPDTDVRTAAAKTLRDTGEEFDMEETSALLLNLFVIGEVRPFFTDLPGRRVLIEQEIVDPDGSLFRMDRLVVDKECATIIDYKTGTDTGAEDRHMEQVRNYMKITAAIIPDRPVIGLIIYIDLCRVVTVQ